MEIRNDVAYILVRQWLARTDLRPVRVAKIRPPSDDDASQALIADEFQIAGVGNLPLPLLMAGGAGQPENVLSMIYIACCRCEIWRHVRTRAVLATPTLAHTCNEDGHLLWSQEAAGRLTKSRHLGSGHAGRDPPLQCHVIDKRLIFRIGQIECRALGAAFSMAGRAVLLVQAVKRDDIFCAQQLFLIVRRADLSLASECAQEQGERNQR